jgi:NADPH-dependent 7-cyano-7-deazaguanine reductase QueF-like protein
LLNFREQIEPLRLRLDDGDVFDEDEFEGRITDLNLDDQIFTIANGQRIQINNQTDISDGDYPSLSDVTDALANNRRIVAEGEYFHPDENVNLWIATEVEFEEESNEFEDLVESLNLAERSLTLINGDELFLTNDSDIDFNDGLSSLQDVSDAAQNGLPVLAEGDFSIDPQSGRRLIEDISFKLEFDEFESTVTAADSVAGMFTLANGRDVSITDNTVIDGDYPTISDVQNAIDQGVSVEADGEYYFDQNNDLWIAVQVTFEDEEEDDDGDGDGDGDDGEED